MAETTSRRTITEEEYVKLVGLLTIAAEHNRALDTIARAVAGITGDDDDGYGYFGCSSDAVSGNHDARSLLSVLDIDVVPAEGDPHHG
jgi:hypothetical protein